MYMLLAILGLLLYVSFELFATPSILNLILKFITPVFIISICTNAILSLRSLLFTTQIRYQVHYNVSITFVEYFISIEFFKYFYLHFFSY
jgi:hypothetical protein